MAKKKYIAYFKSYLYMAIISVCVSFIFAEEIDSVNLNESDISQSSAFIYIAEGTQTNLLEVVIVQKEKQAPKLEKVEKHKIKQPKKTINLSPKGTGDKPKSRENKQVFLNHPVSKSLILSGSFNTNLAVLSAHKLFKTIVKAAYLKFAETPKNYIKLPIYFSINNVEDIFLRIRFVRPPPSFLT